MLESGDAKVYLQKLVRCVSTVVVEVFVFSFQGPFQASSNYHHFLSQRVIAQSGRPRGPQKGTHHPLRPVLGGWWWPQIAQGHSCPQVDSHSSWCLGRWPTDGTNSPWLSPLNPWSVRGGIIHKANLELLVHQILKTVLGNSCLIFSEGHRCWGGSTGIWIPAGSLTTSYSTSYFCYKSGCSWPLRVNVKNKCFFDPQYIIGA